MRLAVPFDPETGLVAEHFGHAPFMKFYTEDDGVVFTDVLPSPANGHFGVTQFLVENGAQVVLCCNMGEGARDALFEAGIAVLAGVMGPADELVIALLENRLRFTDEAACGCHHGGGCNCGECSPEGEGGECGCGCGCGE